MTWTKQKINNLFFFIGVAAVVIMLFTFDVSFPELWEHLCHAGYWLIPIVGIWLFIYFFNALAWRAVIRGTMPERDCPVKFLRLYRLTITGYALNYATPVGGLGGEPYRIMELSNHIGKQHATSSVILYAMMHFVAHFFLWFSAIFIYLALVLANDLPITPAIAIVLSIIAAFCLLAFYLFAKGYRNGLARKGIRWIGKLPGLKKWSERFLVKHDEDLNKIDEQIAKLHAQSKRAFYTSFSLEYLSRIIQSLEIFFMLLLFGVNGGGGFEGYLVTFLHSILILSFTTLFANIIGFLPMQIGVQEGGFVLSIAALGLSAALGVFVSLICRVREIIWIFIGMALMKLK